MKTQDLVLIITTGLVVYLLNEKKKDIKKIDEIKDYNSRLLRLANNQNTRLADLNSELKKAVENKADLPQEIKNNLKKLIDDFNILDKDIAEELISISSLIQINEKPKAIFSISKIIENLLQKISPKNNSFYEMIKNAETKKILTVEECYFMNGLRTIRNKEGHDLNVKIEEHLTAPSFMIGIGIISKLKSLSNLNNQN
jgi:hypothetical protein